ncbi:MAG: hypothetical protein ACU0BF_01720 [Paracoccaceae bacterium]
MALVGTFISVNALGVLAAEADILATALSEGARLQREVGRA